MYGWGQWKRIQPIVKTRTNKQIKSHAQKVLKRIDAGENVFLSLDENRDRCMALVEEANKRINEAQFYLQH